MQENVKYKKLLNVCKLQSVHMRGNRRFKSDRLTTTNIFQECKIVSSQDWDLQSKSNNKQNSIYFNLKPILIMPLETEIGSQYCA